MEYLTIMIIFADEFAIPSFINVTVDLLTAMLANCLDLTRD